MKKFKENVINIVKKVPEGKVVSYGQVALLAGKPRGAREVGWILQATSENIPWWRVVNNQGRISIKNPYHAAEEQKMLLENDGVIVSEDFTFDIKKYRWIPKS